MAHFASAISLFPDEEILNTTLVPFDTDAQSVPLEDLVDSLSAEGMPRSWIGGPESARDALIMAAFVAQYLPEVTETTVKRLCELQGVTDLSVANTRTDCEEVGRIPHRVTVTGSIEFDAIDTTPLFISALARAIEQRPAFLKETVIQRDGEERSIHECLVRAITWLWVKLSMSPTGLLESNATDNKRWQVWQDASDTYCHVDGSLARGTLAAIEVQAFAYDALSDVTDLMRAKLIAGDPNLAWTRAQRLRRTIIELAWVVSPDAGSFFAAGVETHKDETRPLAVRTANMGLLLNSKLLDGGPYERYVDATISQLFDNNGLLSSTGLRTLAVNERRYRPESDFSGAVWPWQNLWIANGLRRHNRLALADQLEVFMRRIADVTRCAPEFVQGANHIRPEMNEAEVTLRSFDGHGGTYEHLAMRTAQRHYGPTVFGLYALQLAERINRTGNVRRF